jgi:hypothetical protein
MAALDAPITAPWWWPLVHDQLAPQIRSLATTTNLRETAAVQRVWAMAGTMVNCQFSSDTLQIMFPELCLLPVEHVGPWKRREAFIRALEDGPEAGLARTALGHLGLAAQEGALPPLPTRPAPRTPRADWRTVFSRSTLGRDIFFVRGTHRSHSGLKAIQRRRVHPHFRTILEVCERYGLVRSSFSTGSPVHASSYEDHCAFLDGGLMSKAGGYLVGLHGAWVFGREAVRFLCLELGLTPPDWPERTGSAPPHRDLVRRLLIQLATDLAPLHERLTQLERFAPPRPRRQHTRGNLM